MKDIIIGIIFVSGLAFFDNHLLGMDVGVTHITTLLLLCLLLIEKK